jgi:phosphopantothenoylcysteine synthetase/decarboxylase
MNVLLGISGSIAAYKACDIISGLKATGHDVQAIMTENSKRFITPLTIESLTGHPIVDMWKSGDGVEHIEIAKWCDVFIVAPATANTIAKIANGIADDTLSTIALAVRGHKLKYIYPAMNTNMLNNRATEDNIKRASLLGYFIGETECKMLACGDMGKGGLLSPRKIVEEINKIDYATRDYARTGVWNPKGK